MKITKIVSMIVVFCLFAAGGALAGNSEKPAGILSLTGVGKVKYQPDMAIVQIGVISESPTAGLALADNNVAMRQIMKILRHNFINKKDVQTSSFNISPRYIRMGSSNNGRQLPQIAGYNVTNNLKVTVRDIKRLGRVLDGVVKAGSNQIHSVSFSLADMKAKRQQAMKLAVADAIERAQIYATAGGFKLGRLTGLSEPGSGGPQPVFARAMAMNAMSDGVPVAAGEQTLSMRVFMSWAIE